MDAVFVDLQPVRHRHHRGELHAKLMLGRADFVVMLLDRDAHLGHGAEHFRADVLRGVLRRHREIALLESDVMAEIAALVIGVAVDRQLDGIELETRVVGLGRVFHVVEDEELGFRPEEYGVAEPQ